MLTSVNGKALLQRIPKERVLVESDFPHVRTNGVSVSPLEIQGMIGILAGLWKMPVEETGSQLRRNFQDSGALGFFANAEHK